MSEYLQTQIAARRNRLASLDRERATLIAELSAYEDALANEANSSAEFNLRGNYKERERSLPVSKAWRAILQRLADFRHFNASDVKLVAQKLYDDGTLKKPQTNDGVRAQLSLYAKKGIIRRKGGGSYLLTDQTRSALASPSFALAADVDRTSKLAWAKADNSGPSHGG